MKQKINNNIMDINWVKPAAKDRVFHVSPTGDLSTIAAARDAIRALPETKRHAHTIRVLIHGGTYFLDAPLVFTPEDSGTPKAPIIYQAAPGERPRISGGQRLTGWQESMENNRRLWTVQLPEVLAGRWTFTQLFVDGRRCPRARLPETGFYLLTNVMSAADTRTGSFRPGDLQAWHNLEDVEVIAPHYWLDSHLRIESLDIANDRVTFTTPGARPLDDELRRGGCRYWMENVREAMVVPGQWYLDRRSGVLSYLPLAHERLGQVEIIAPCLDQLVCLEGTGNPEVMPVFSNPGWPKVTIEVPPSRPDILMALEKVSTQAVHDLHFVGLDFAHVEWDYPVGKPGDPQAAFTVPGAICMRHAHHCSLRLNRIGRIAGYAVEIDYGCHHLAVVANQLDDLGAGGIKLGHGSHFSHVTDNSIRHCGRRFPSAIGIWIGHSGDNFVVHNHIHDLFYTGISVGWIWGFAPSLARRNRIEANHIHHIGQGLLSDMGGVYSLGVSPGTRICGNHIHDVSCYGYGGSGLYPDEGTAFVLYEDNVVHHNHANLSMNYGRDNLVRNNLLMLARERQVGWGTPQHFGPWRLEHNVVYFREGACVQGRAMSGLPQVAFDHNIYWRDGGDAFDLCGADWAQWQVRGFDTHGQIVNPLLVDPDAGSPTLREDSPAMAYGFRPIDMSQVGPREDVLKTGVSPSDESPCGPIVWSCIEPDRDLPAGGRAESLYFDYPDQTPCNFTLRAIFENAGDAHFTGPVTIEATPASALSDRRSWTIDLELAPGQETVVRCEIDVVADVEEIVLRAESEADGFWPCSVGFAFRPTVSVPPCAAPDGAASLRDLLPTIAPRLPVWHGSHELGAFHIALCDDRLALLVDVNDANIDVRNPVHKGSMVDLFAIGSTSADPTGQVAQVRGQTFLVPGNAEHPARLLGADAHAIPGADVWFETTADGYAIAALIPLSALNITIVDGEFAFTGAIYTHLEGIDGVLRASLFNQRSPADIHAFGRMIITD